MLLVRLGSTFLFCRPILFVADPFHPIDHLAVLLFLNGHVCHRRRRRSPMPVLLAGREPDHIARADFLDQSAPTLCPAAASRNDENLTQRMRVPCSPRARLESYAGTL